MDNQDLAPSSLDQPIYRPHVRTFFAPVGRPWPPVIWLAVLAIAGLSFLGLMLLVVSGLFGLLSGISTVQPQQQRAPILLVIPSLGAATGTAEISLLPDSELKALVDAPVVQALPLPAEVSNPAVQPIAPITITYRALFQEVGAAYGIDWRLLAAIAYRESRLDANAVGRDGDMGLMQILPGTWNEFAPSSIAVDPFEPRHNVEVAATYLLYLQDYLNGLGHGEIYWVLAAYNWGPENVRRLIANGGSWDQVPDRPRRYVADILQSAFGIRFAH
jgi:hypothetical protein